MKRCAKCKMTKPVTEFNKSVNAKDGLQCYCRDCQKECRGEGDYMLRWTYGISLEDKRRMIDEQGGVCFTCKKPFTSTNKTHVDHCHETEKIRGILCSNCNTTLGLVYESPAILQNMIDYLEHHAQENTATPVPEGHYSESEEHTKHWFVPPTGFGEDGNDAYHHCGADAWEDFDYSAEESGGDGVGCGSEEVGTLTEADYFQSLGLAAAEVISVTNRIGYLYRKFRECRMANRAESELPESSDRRVEQIQRLSNQAVQSLKKTAEDLYSEVDPDWNSDTTGAG